MASEAKLSGLEVRWQLDLLPDGRQTILRLRGPSLATLSPVAEVILPDWGPYELSGSLTSTEDAYALRDLKVSVGESQMSGSLHLRMLDDLI